MLFSRSYYIDKIREYNKKISPKESNAFKITKINGLKGIVDYYFYQIEDEIKEPIIEISDERKTWMRLTPLEIEGCYESIKRAKGKVGVVGLGIGYFVQEILKKEKVKEVIVYESSKDVIDLYLDNFGEDKRVKIINEDAFKGERESFDFFFVDIYQYKLTKDMGEHYKFFNELHDIYEYSFWGMERFLLNCQMEDIVYLYIPEEWMEMAKDLYGKLGDSNHIKDFKQIDYEIIKKVLKSFEEVLK